MQRAGNKGSERKAGDENSGSAEFWGVKKEIATTER
jgi:hypothetical protein